MQKCHNILFLFSVISEHGSSESHISGGHHYLNILFVF